jgi:hypothetical protein
MSFKPSRIIPRAFAAAAVGAITVGLVAVAPAANAASTDHLSCSGQGTLSFSPGVGSTPGAIQGRGTGTLENCTSPDGSASDIKSGYVTGTGSGTVGCYGPVSGTWDVTVTWYSGPNRTGNVVGTTVAHGQGLSVQIPDSGSSQLGLTTNGAVGADSDRFAGGSVQATGFLIPNITVPCSDFSRVYSANVSGTVTISG